MNKIDKNKLQIISGGQLDEESRQILEQYRIAQEFFRHNCMDLAAQMPTFMRQFNYTKELTNNMNNLGGLSSGMLRNYIEANIFSVERLPGTYSIDPKAKDIMLRFISYMRNMKIFLEGK